MLDEPRRLLLVAITEENSDLLVRVHHGLRQNHLLLSRWLLPRNGRVDIVLPGTSTTATGTDTTKASWLHLRSP